MALPNPHLLENDYQRFSDLVYTRFGEAVRLLRERQSADMFSEVERDGLVEIPEVLQRNGVAVLFRQIGTPNHEMKRFLQLTSEYSLTPVVWEYLADKFVPGNAMKYAWGRLGFYKGLGRNGGLKIDYLNVIDFNSADGVALRDVQTLWGQPLVEFHHR